MVFNSSSWRSSWGSTRALSGTTSAIGLGEDSAMGLGEDMETGGSLLSPRGKKILPTRNRMNRRTKMKMISNIADAAISAAMLLHRLVLPPLIMKTSEFSRTFWTTQRLAHSLPCIGETTVLTQPFLAAHLVENLAAQFL